MYVYDDNDISNNDVRIGSGFLGHLNISYSELEKELGPPLGPFNDDKTLCQWVIKFSDGSIATIYNFKDGINYDPENGLIKEDITNWHVGGFNPDVLEKISLLFSEAILDSLYD